MCVCMHMYTHKNECASMGMYVAWHVCEGQRTTTLESQFLFFEAVTLLLLWLHILGKWPHQLPGHPPVSTSHLVTRSVGITDAQNHIMWVVGTEGFHCIFCYFLRHLPGFIFGSVLKQDCIIGKPQCKLLK